MRKIITVIGLAFTLISGTVLAQGPTPFLTFRLANQVVIDGGANPDTLQFDVEVKCDTLNTYHLDMILYLDYNTQAFGSNIFTNGGLFVEKVGITEGQLAPGPSFAYYLLAVNDNTSSKIAIGTIGNFANTAALNLVDTSYLPAYRVKMVILDNDNLADLIFDGSLMGGGQFYIFETDGLLFQYNTSGFGEDLEYFPLFDLDDVDLLISEIADPEAPDSDAKFIELYNPTQYIVSFTYYNAWLNTDQSASGYNSVRLQGIIWPDSTYVVASDSTEFHNKYGFAADQVVPVNITGNGDEAIALSRNSGAQDGSVIDIFGVQGISGSGEDWEYADSKAVRKFGIDSPNPTFTLSEWVIPGNPGSGGSGPISAAAVDMTPKSHRRTITWTGTISTDWRNKGNWDLGVIPDAAHNVVVKSEPGPVIDNTTNAYSNDVSIAPPGGE